MDTRLETDEPDFNLRDINWLAVYSDGDVLPQYNHDGTQNSYATIQRDKLTEFHLVDASTGDALFSMSLEPRQRLIFRRRVSMDGESGQLNWVVYLVGWQETVHGTNVQSLNWIFPTGQVINTGKFKENHPVFYSIDFHSEELEDADGEEEFPDWQDGDDG